MVTGTSPTPSYPSLFPESLGEAPAAADVIASQPAAKGAWGDDAADAEPPVQESAFVEADDSFKGTRPAPALTKKPSRVTSMLPPRNKLVARTQSKYKDDSDSETDTDEDDDDERGEASAEAVCF